MYAAPGASPSSVAGRFTLLAGAVCSLAAWFTAGTTGLAAGLMATALVIAFFWAGLVPLFVVRSGESGVGMGLSILLLTYTLRLALVLLVLRFTQRLEFVDGRWVGVTIVACALTWMAAQVATSVRGGRRRSAGRSDAALE